MIQSMKSFKLIPFLLILFGVFPQSNLAYAELKDPEDYKVLSSTNKKLSIANVL